MRPRGEIRQALAQAGAALADEHGGFTWREAAALARVGFTAARQTVANMERAGELECVGQRHVPGVCRPMNVYAPRRASEPAAGISLDQAMRGWGRGQAHTEARDEDPELCDHDGAAPARGLILFG